MELSNLIKVLVLFFSITIFINYGIHSIIINNSHNVRDSAIDFVNKNCIEEYGFNNLYYDGDLKKWKPINENFNLSTGTPEQNLTK